MGFDKPWWQQYGAFIRASSAAGPSAAGAASIQCSAPCFGYSFRLSDTVTDLIATHFPVTLSIAVGAAILWLIAGVGAGVLVGGAPRLGGDRITMTVAMAGVSTPSYLLGLLGILLFGFTLNMVPVSGYVPLFVSPIDWAWHLILPWCVLAFISAAIYARLTRGQMLDVLSEDYIRTARAKGLGEGRVIGSARAAQRAHPGHHHLRPRPRRAPRRSGDHREGVQHAGPRRAAAGCGRQHRPPRRRRRHLFAAFLIILANVVVDMVYGLLDPRV